MNHIRWILMKGQWIRQLDKGTRGLDNEKRSLVTLARVVRAEAPVLWAETHGK